MTRVTVRSLPTASTRRGLDERATAYLFVAPAVTTLLLVVLYPFASAVWISFQDKDLAVPGRFVGFANYVELWNQSGFARVVRNTALYVGAAVAAKFVLGLAAALVLSMERRASGLYRTILVNTERGPVSAAANRRPESGWHHLAGVYDGRAIKLYIDGELVGSRSASGRIVRPGVPLTVGQLGGGGGRFDGTIADVRISAGARTAEWIRTTYETLRDPDGLLPADRMTFARVSVNAPREP